MTFMIYGATGYTGTLIAEAAAARGKKPVLAGRTEGPLRALAERLGLRHKVVGLDDNAALVGALDDVSLVLHCAGPFVRTSKPMVQACLQAKKHYLDITGEIGVFEAVMKKDSAAREAGVVLLPGVGFDVVPSDCQAAHVKGLLPDADTLELFVQTRGGASHGTLRTAVEGLHLGGAVRVSGAIVSEPLGARQRSFTVAGRSFPAFSVPWGDVSTAFHSTGIPNVVVYFPSSPVVRAWLRMRPLHALFQIGALRALLARTIPAGGPDAATRARGSTRVLAVARNSKTGAERQSLLTAPEGYTLTVDAALLCVKHVLAGKVSPGAWTPSHALGADLVLELDGVTRTDP